MPVKLFQKQAKQGLFSQKKIFRQKNNVKKARKEPPKRTFKTRKVTWWTLFCTTFLFPLVLKIVNAANQAGQIAGQTGMPVAPPDATGAAAAGGVAAGVGVVGAASAGLMELGAVIALSESLGSTFIGTAAASVSTAGEALFSALGATGGTLLGIGPVGWIIIAIAIIVIAVLLALSFAGIIDCSSCMSGCGGQQAVAGQPPTSQQTSSVQSGTQSQVVNP